MYSSLKNRAAQNAVWIIACKAVQAIIGFLISLLVARYLRPERYGMLNYAASVAMFLSPIAQLGFAYVLVQELVDYPEQEGEILGSAVGASFVSGLFCSVGMSLFVKLYFPNDILMVEVCALYSLLLVAQSGELIRYWYQKKLLAKYSAVVTLIAYIIMCIYQLILFFEKKSLVWFAAAKSIEYIIIAIVLIFIYNKLDGRRLTFSLRIVKRMLLKSSPYMASALLVMAFAQADRIMIRLMLNDTATGFYAAAVTCANLTEFVFVAIIDSLRPIILEKKKYDKKIYESGISALYCVVICLSVAQSIVITVFAKPIVLILYGSAYAPAIGALKIIVWYTAFSYIGTVRNIWILAEQKQKYLWFINMMGVLFNIGMNAIAIPRWGIEGAAFTSLLTQVFTNVIIGFVIRPIRDNNRLLKNSFYFSNVMAFLKQIH